MHSTPKVKTYTDAQVKQFLDKELVDRRMDAIQENAAMRQSALFKAQTKLLNDPRKILQKTKARGELNY
jgi:hypothetical protein